jgi:hypothetical protein
VSSPLLGRTKKKNKTAHFRAPVSAASQPANRYAERNARYTAGTPGLEQFSPACHEIVCGCRSENRHPTPLKVLNFKISSTSVAYADYMF